MTDEPGLTALILVGGFGTRLRDVVSDRPKALAEISGRPFLAWQLDHLAAGGVTDAVLCTHYMSEMIEAAFPPGRLANGMTVAHSREPEPLGTGGALRLGLDAAPEGAGPVLGVNGDTFCAFDLPAFLQDHDASGACASILLTEVDDIARYGAVETDTDGWVTAFLEKGAAGRAGPGWINAGVYLLDRAMLGALPRLAPISIERDVFPDWIGKGLRAHKGPRPTWTRSNPRPGRASGRPGPAASGGGA